MTVAIAPLLLGEVDRGLIPPVLFRIPNVKQQEMTIELIERSCGCQTVELPEQPVSAGGTAEISMRIDPPRRAEKKAYWAMLALAWGTEKERVKVHTELEVIPELLNVPADVRVDFASEEAYEQPISIKQRVRSDAEPEPVQPQFQELPEELELVALEHAGSRQMRWDGQGSSGQTQNAQQGSIWEIEWRATLRLTMTERVRKGLDGQFLVACGEGAWSRVRVPIRLRCVEVIQASPSHTYFGSLEPSEERRKTVLLRSRDEQEFEISEILCDSPAFWAQVTVQEAKRMHILQVVFFSAQAGQHTGRVHVSTTHPKCPEVILTVEGSVVGQTVGNGDEK